VAEPHDLDARAACQMACTMSGMAAINAMVSVVHAIGHIVGGRYALRACIVNFHTTLADVEALPEIVARVAQEVDAELRPTAAR